MNPKPRLLSNHLTFPLVIPTPCSSFRGGSGTPPEHTASKSPIQQLTPANGYVLDPRQFATDVKSSFAPEMAKFRAVNARRPEASRCSEFAGQIGCRVSR